MNLSPSIANDQDQTMTHQTSSWLLERWQKLLRHTTAIIGLVYLMVLVVVALFAPFLVAKEHNPVTIVSGQGNLPPVWEQEGVPSGTWEYPLGTDGGGRSLLSRLIYGTRTSLFVGVATMILTLIIGVPLGIIGGFLGGWVDQVLMRVTDIVYSFPAFLFFIVVMAALRGTPLGSFWNGFPVLFAALALIGWADIARQIRAKTQSVKKYTFVEASRALGASGWHIVWRHIIPHAYGPVIVLGTYIIPDAIFTEAALSYLGLGLPLSTDASAPFSVSWGSMIIEAQTVFATRPWQMIPPVLAVASVTLAVTFLGDGLRDVFDPQDKTRKGYKH